MATTDAHIARVLEIGKFGEIGKNIFTGYDVPTKPDAMLIVVDSGTFLPDNPSLNYSHPSIQITVRGNKGHRQDAGDKAIAINMYLQYWHGVVNDVRFVYINNSYGPVSMPPDDHMRPIFVINFNMQQCPK